MLLVPVTILQIFLLLKFYLSHFLKDISLHIMTDTMSTQMLVQAASFVCKEFIYGMCVKISLLFNHI